MLNRFKKKLVVPEIAGYSLDDPALTAKRREVIQNKEFLRRIYLEWYGLLSAALPYGPGGVLEIGSGGGFMKQFIPDLITSDVFSCPDADMVIDACGKWPLKKDKLKAVLMVDVLHHLPEVHCFFHEAGSSIRSGGIIAMVEPWVTSWSRLVFSRLHHEPFMPLTKEWGFPSIGPLSGANSALPWIIFYRDRQIFEKKFPTWKIKTIRPLMPFCYPLSGGVSLRSFIPGKLYGPIRQFEKLTGLEQRSAMFAFIVLQKV